MTVYALLTEKQTFFDANSVELTGGKLFVYLAGTTTKATSYTETDGLVANSNPITLNSRGEVPSGLYVAGGATYKLVLAPSTDTDPPTSPIWTRDNLAPIGYVAPTTPSTQWESGGATATRLSNTQFQVTGDYTTVFLVNRRIKCTITAGAGFIVGRITAATFALGVTSVTVEFDSGVLDTGVNNTTPMVGIITPTNTSFPVVDDEHLKFSDPSDKTKLARWDIGNNTTATTRIRTWYDKDGYETVANDLTPLHNCSLAASVSGGNLVLELKTNAGQNPSASDPAIIAFRNASATSGNPSIVAVTAATSFTVTSGSTLGFSNSESGRVWVCAISNAGTVELACYRSWDGSNLLKIDEGIVSTTAEGTGTADSAQVLYSATARANVAMRYLGYIEIQYGVATWTNSPTLIRTAFPHMPFPGSMIQSRYSATGAYATGTSQVPNDDTIPQSGEGTQFMSMSITPTSSLNCIVVESRGLYTTNAAGEYVTVSLFSGGANALVSGVSSQNAADPQMQTLYTQGIGGTTSAITYTVRAGTASGANATYFNGWSAGRQRGGVVNSYIRAHELMV